MKTLEIKKIQKQITRTGQYGDFTLQGATALDLDTKTEVAVMFNSLPDQSHLLGKTIIASNTQDGEYQGKKQITVGKKSEIKVIGGETQTPPTNSQPEQKEETKNNNSAPTSRLNTTMEKRGVELIKYFMSELKNDIHDEAVLAETARSLTATILINEN